MNQSSVSRTAHPPLKNGSCARNEIWENRHFFIPQLKTVFSSFQIVRKLRKYDGVTG